MKWEFSTCPLMNCSILTRQPQQQPSPRDTPPSPTDFLDLVSQPGTSGSGSTPGTPSRPQRRNLSLFPQQGVSTPPNQPFPASNTISSLVESELPVPQPTSLVPSAVFFVFPLFDTVLTSSPSRLTNRIF